MRTDLETIAYDFNDPFEVLDIFESKLADFFGSAHCVLVDSCTHGIELCLRLTDRDSSRLAVPLHTYLSVPMTLDKLGIDYDFKDIKWEKYYQIHGTDIYDAATLWQPQSYLPGTMMTLSFQHKKHIKIGRGGAVLLDDPYLYQRLKKARYDGRDLTKPHHLDQIEEIGYHYYMTPEDAALGLRLFDQNKHQPARIWSYKDYVPLNNYKVFQGVKLIP